MPMTSPVERISGPSTRVDDLALAGAEPLERQHRLLDRDRRVDRQPAAVAVRRQQALRAQLRDGRAHHDARGRLGQRDPGRLRHERHRARGPRVGLEDVEHVLRRSRTARSAARARRCPRRACSVASRTRSISVAAEGHRRQGAAESPEWMPASSMCSMIPPRYSSLAVVERVDVDLDRVVEEPVDEQRVLGADDAVARGRSSRPGSRRRRRSPCRGRRARRTGGRAPGSRSPRRPRRPPRRCRPCRASGRGRSGLGEDAAERAALLGEVDGLRAGAEDRDARVLERLARGRAAVWPPSCTMTPATGPACRSAWTTSRTSSSVSGSK